MEARAKVWHPQEELVLKQWVETCNAYAWLHAQSEEEQHLWSLLLTIPTIVLNGVGAGLCFISWAQEIIYPMSIAVGILNMIAAVLTVLERTLGFGERHQEHRECSMLFKKVARYIVAELSLPKEDRAMDGALFVRFAGFEAERVLQMHVPVSERVKRRFRKFFGSQTLADLERYGEIRLMPFAVGSAPPPSSSSSSSSSSYGSGDQPKSITDLRVAIVELVQEFKGQRASMDVTPQPG